MCGPTLIDTTDSIALQSQSLQEVFSVQSEAINSALSYDCATYRSKEACFSIGGHHGGAEGSAAGGAVLGMSYRLNSNFTVGGYLNKAVSNRAKTGIDIDDGMPMLGLSLGYAQNSDNTGFKARIAGGYDESDITLRRVIVGSSEAGIGYTDLNTKGAEAQLSYGVTFNNAWLATPYAGLRYTNITRDGYTEQTGIASPMTYGALTDSATTARAGVRVEKKVSERLTLGGSAGAEYDITRTSGTNAATGGVGSVSVDFGADDRKFRGTASIGGAFELTPQQSIVAGVSYRQESFQGSDTVGATVALQIGF